jgi:hypothetical protein
MKYITDADYCRAKNQAGNTPLFKVYHLEDRKLFPFHIFTNFHGSVSRGGLKTPVRSKYIPPLTCGHCSEPLNDWGNGSYYTAYIVFDSATEFYACCPQCKPKDSLDFHCQIYGHKHPMTIGIYESSQKHRAVMRAGFSHSKLFKAWDYKSATAEQLRDELGMDRQGGASFDGGFLDYNHLRIRISDSKYDRLYEIKPAETVALVNDIIKWNHQQTTIPREGVQIQLF